MAQRADGGGNPSEEDRKKARGYNNGQVQELWNQFNQALEAYNADPSVANANAMSRALQLLQDAGENGQDPGGRTLASAMSASAQNAVDQAYARHGDQPANPASADAKQQPGAPPPAGGNMGMETAGAIGVNPSPRTNNFQGGLAPSQPGGGAVGNVMGGGGGGGIASQIAQSLIAQNPGAQAGGQAIGGPQQPVGQAGVVANGGPTTLAGPYANNPETFTGTQSWANYQSNPAPPNDQAFGGPGQPDSIGMPHDSYYNGSQTQTQAPGPGATGMPNMATQNPALFGGGLTNPGNTADTTAAYSNDPNSWWAQAGIGTNDLYGDFNPLDTENGGFTNVLNAYEQQNNLPGYWSDQMGPLIQQAILNSYLGGNPLDSQTEILNAIPQLATQLSTPGSYYNPGSDWGAFLQNPMPSPTGSGVDAFSAQPAQSQIGWVQHMWQNIAGQSVDTMYLNSGSYQIQALGEQWVQAKNNGYTGNFLDFMRANGADSWL